MPRGMIPHSAQSGDPQLERHRLGGHRAWSPRRPGLGLGARASSPDRESPGWLSSLRKSRDKGPGGQDKKLGTLKLSLVSELELTVQDRTQQQKKDGS